jgi:antitoxin CptB
MAALMDDNLDARWRRLHWSCRRGMRELDVLLTRYVNSCAVLPTAEGTRELALIEQLLELQDPELQRYLLAGESPENPDLAALVARIAAPPRVR